MKLTAKQRHELRLLKYLSDWDNEFPKRIDMPAICGITIGTLYNHFTSAELAAIENEALEIRKKNSGRQRSEIYKAMHIEAVAGNVTAMEKFLDRTEGKVPDKQLIDQTVTHTIIVRRSARDGEDG